MKYKYLALAFAAAALTACDDQIMEWQPADGTVSSAELPLQLQEQIANYKPIKEYVKQYHPEVNLAVGMSADLYIDNDQYRQIVNDNFTGVTLGNAMKHQSVVSASGVCNWEKVDKIVELLPSDMKLYGHNLLWHTQQQTAYLKSLIQPEMQIEVSTGDICINVVSNGDFESGNTNGWSYWSHCAASVESPGHDSGKCLHMTMDEATAVNYDSQLWWSTTLEAGQVYAYEFWCKSDCNLAVQFIGQNESYSGLYKDTFTAGADWTYCTGEFEYTGSPADVIRIGLQFGGTPDSNLWIDDFKFGIKNDKPAETCYNVLTGDNSDFEGGTTGGWGSWGSNKDDAAAVQGQGHDSDYAYMLKNKGDGNAWEAQAAYTFDEPLKKGVVYQFKCWGRSDSPAGGVQFQYQNGTTYGSQGGYTDIALGTEWTPVEIEFTINDYDDVNRIILNYGKIGGTYYIDDIQFGEKIDQGGKAAVRPLAGVTYVIKSPEEKKAILLDYMEQWIKEACTRYGDRVDGWDVINEPIADGYNTPRGINGVFGGTWDDNGETKYDSEPTEDTTNGLNLNWSSAAGNGHFYWGYYCGMDYAVKAYEFARKYAPNAKLFVNDYNLEVDPAKLNALIEFVNYVDTHGAHIDGIGTQMHVNIDLTLEKIQAMFKTLAATGKLIRVTELDVAIGSSAPSAEQYAKQAQVYQWVIESYFEIIPEAQRSSITIWTLSDKANEHEYWLNGDKPNLFDEKYARKHAYKAVCDAIAGYDVATDFKGDMWKDVAPKADEEEAE